jgi:membrane associated rhomboid family serine protease
MLDHNAPPLNPLPPVVWALVLPMIALELFFQVGATGLVGGPTAIGWRVDAIQQLAFVPALWRELWAYGDFPAKHLVRFVSYPFVHGNVTHAVFAIVIALALGKFVAEVLRASVVLMIFFGSTIAGALAYGAFVDQAALFGAYPPGYGLVGAFTFLMYVRLIGTGNEYRAFTMIGVLLFAQLIFGVFFGGGPEWVADLAGFVAGFVLTALLSPGGVQRLRDRIRYR